MMAAQWALATETIAAGFGQSAVFRIFGKFQTRVVLFLTKKEKAGREPKGWPSLKAICELFKMELALTQMSKLLQGSSSSSSSAGGTDLVRGLADLTPSLAALTHNKQLKLGQCYHNLKHVRVEADKLYMFVKITDREATFEHSPLFSAAKEIVSLPLDELKDWKPFHGTATIVVPAPLALASQFTLSASMLQERVKSQAFALLCEHDEAEAISNDAFSFTCSPQALFTNGSHKAKQLKIYPVGLLSNNSVDAEKNCVVTFHQNGSDHQLVVQPPKSTLDLTKLDNNDKSVLVPFFWVKTTSDPLKANVERFKYTIQGCLTIPFYQNTKPVAKHEQLLIFKAPEIQKKKGTAPAAIVLPAKRRRGE